MIVRPPQADALVLIERGDGERPRARPSATSGCSARRRAALDANAVGPDVRTTVRTASRSGPRAGRSPGEGYGA